jgi:putative mRNA 3-end processing factor
MHPGIDSSLFETPDGLYCPAGGFWIDPWRPVERAVITHAHSDHARPGCGRYLCAARSDGDSAHARAGAAIMRARLGPSATIETLPFGHMITIGDATLSMHPAGHVLGSAQVRIEVAGHVCVVSGDYKLAHDPTCDAFEPVRCHTFITESTFGLPVFRWNDPRHVGDEINAWWRESQAAGRTCVLSVYSLGKAQRVLSLLDPSIGPIMLHGSVDAMTSIYRDAGVPLPATIHATRELVRAAAKSGTNAMVLAPGSAIDSAWSRGFGDISVAAASGWMRIRGTRRRQNLDRGFVLSDHADWPGLLEAVRATGASRVGVTHGYVRPMTRWLAEQGLDAFTISTRFEGEASEIRADDDAPTSNDGGAP